MDIVTEAWRAVARTSSNRSRALSLRLLGLAGIGLSFFLAGCVNAPKTHTTVGSDPPKPPSTTLASQQEGGTLVKELEAISTQPEPRSKPAAALARPTPAPAKTPLASPKASESAVALSPHATTTAHSHLNPVATQAPASEAPMIQDTSAAPPEPQKALVFKGPPRTAAPKPRARGRTVIWIGALLCVLAAAGAVVFVVRCGWIVKGLPKVKHGATASTASGRLALEGAPEPPEAAPGE